MNRRLIKLAASGVSLSIVLFSPGGAALEAAAQTFAAGAASRSGMSTGSAAASARLQRNGSPVRFSTLGTNPGLKAGLAPSMAPGVSAPGSIGGSPVVSAALSPESAGTPAYVPGSEEAAMFNFSHEQAVPAEAIGALTEAVRPDDSAQTDAQPGWRLDRMYDGLSQRRASDSSEAVAAVPSRHLGTQLGRSLPGSEIKTDVSAPTPVPARPVRAAISKTTLAVGVVLAALALGMSTIALAGAAPVVTASASLMWLASAQPLASAGAAVVGALYGLIAAHRKAGETGTPEVLSSVLRYGVMAGAGVFVLMNLTQALFLGLPFLAAHPVTSSVATAALGQAAFQGKFTEAATTPADRLMTAFPAVAAALGLSLGIAFMAPSMLLAASVGAMSLAGVAAAVYAAVYQPGKSAVDGPSKMARGFVLQSLMTGIGLALTDPLMVAPFAIMAAWGLWEVVSTSFNALVAAMPDLPARFRKK